MWISLPLLSLRVWFFFAGLSGVLWTLELAPSLLLTTSAREQSAILATNIAFKRGALLESLNRIDSGLLGYIVHPELVRLKALLGVRIAEQTMQAGGTEDADHARRAESLLRYALCQSPTDGFLWLLLYSLQVSRYGLEIPTLAYLEQSYRLAPLEGWVALLRNKQALAAMSFANPAVKRSATAEFAALVDGRFAEEAAANLTTVGWTEHDNLLAALGQTDIVGRERLSRVLFRGGWKIRVPGIDLDERPWR